MMLPVKMPRRQFILAGAATALSTPALAQTVSQAAAPQLPANLMPQVVDIQNNLPVGEIHVVPDSFHLFLIIEGQRAIRYGVGVGRRGLYESGTFTIRRKQEWPDWRPTDEMIEREPEKYEQFADGVPGGPNNPLGARALYLYTGNRDTYLRIHGTNAPRTIGSAVSNGCARLVNDHMIDLYNRVPLQTRVVLHPKVTSA